jgi:hypothetical protein
MYFANSTTAHAALATGSGAQTASIETVQSVFVFAANNNGTGPADKSKKRLSFAAITQGMTSVQSASLYTLVQALRTALGGGFV